MARATASWSKAARSVRLPPPRTTATTSARRAAAAMAAASSSGARTPCTAAWTSVTSKASPLESSLFITSAWAALPSEVTRPTRRGTGASGRPALARSRPSRARVCISTSRSATMSPRVWAGSMAVMRIWSRPEGGW